MIVRRPPPVISRKTEMLVLGSLMALGGGLAALVASIFWTPSVLLPLGIGGIVGAWLLFEVAMEEMARDNHSHGRRWWGQWRK